MHLLIEPCAPDACIERALYWINGHVKSPVVVDEVAQFCHLSSSQLQRRFKYQMGSTVASYWRMKKLQLAKQLLSSSCLSIETIAYDLGYESPAAFNRRFHQMEGMAPGVWRKMHGSAKNRRETDH